MPGNPSIKGTVFAQVVDELWRIEREGKVGEKELRERLLPGDLPILRDRLLASGWYPIDVYERVNLLLKDVAGSGKDEYLVEQGRRTARRLMEDGYYQQVRHTARVLLGEAASPEERSEAFGYDLRLFVSLSASILNFSRWSAAKDPDFPLRYVVEVREASAIPEVLCLRCYGFINALAAAHGSPDLWAFERPSRDAMFFKMRQDL